VACQARTTALHSHHLPQTATPACWPARTPGEARATPSHQGSAVDPIQLILYNRVNALVRVYTLSRPRARRREFPAVEKFVRGRAGGIAGLALSHRLGALPRLRLHGGPGGESESARVDRWRGEDIEAYLADRLEGYAPAADA